MDLAAIWSDVLSLDEVGVHDSFFDLGGHSLLLPTMHRLLEERVGVTLKLVELFRFSTVAAIAEALLERAGARETSKRAALCRQASYASRSRRVSAR